MSDDDVSANYDEVSEVEDIPPEESEKADDDLIDDEDVEQVNESRSETDEENEDDEDEPTIGDTPYDVRQVSKNNKEIIIVSDDERITPNILSKYEMTRIISIRATQISEHNNPMIDVSDLTDPIKMAKRELMERKCPLTLRRVIGDRKNVKNGEMETFMEIWHPNEMVFADEYIDV